MALYLSLLSPPVTYSGPQRNQACPSNSLLSGWNVAPIYKVDDMPSRRNKIFAHSACGKQLLFHGVNGPMDLIAQWVFLASSN